MTKYLESFKSIVNDSWQNVVTQLGTTYDKLTYHRAYGEPWRIPDELESMYYCDPFAQRTIREPVDAAFRNGHELVYGGELDAEVIEPQKELINEHLFSLEAVERLKKALYWGRLYGRGGLLLGVDDGGSPDMELNLEAANLTLDWVEPLTSEEFTPLEYQDDPSMKDFGAPILYTVQRTGGTASEQSTVHASRIIITGAVPTDRQSKSDNDWRDAPILQAAFNALRNLDSAISSAANMMTDSSQAVLKIRQFAEMLGSEDISVFTNRMRIMELARSLRILPIDADTEDFQYVERSFTGVHELIDKMVMYASGAVGMPQTVFIGSSPAGLNATGESDIRGWYDQVQSERATDYGPKMEMLVFLSALTVGADSPETWGIEWASLWQETAMEFAERQKVVMETDVGYIGAQVIQPEEVTIARFGGGEWSADSPQIDVEARMELLEMERERALNPPTPPPPGQFEPNEEDEGEEEAEEDE